MKDRLAQGCAHNTTHNTTRNTALPPLPYARPSITDAERKVVLAVLQGSSPQLTQGARLLQFEQEVAQAVHASHAVACANATAALHLALRATGVSENDRVLTQSVSFCATANAVRHCNAVPVFADIDPATLGLSPRSAREAVRKATQASTSPVKVIVPVSMGGGADARNAEALFRLKRDLNCLIVEDAAHALGGFYDRQQHQPVGGGTYADITVFSFHPIKPVTCAEGGVAVTNNPQLASRMRLLRNHGIERNRKNFRSPLPSDAEGNEHYEMQELGFNYRLSELHAALGVAQMQRLHPLREQRRALAEYYDRLIENSSLAACITLLQKSMRAHSAHHLYIVAVDWKAFGMPRRVCMDKLKRQGILTQVHYIPIHHHPYYRQRGMCETPVSLAHSEHYAEQALSLPLFADMQTSDVERVVEALEGLRQCVST